MTRRMHLGLFTQSHGYHAGGWRLPEAVGAAVDLPWMTEIARTAERGLLDLLLLADGLALDDPARASTAARFEPLTLLGALAPATRRIGLAATVSTSFTHPYTVARTLASLDHLSAGRAAWNVVTSSTHAEARSYGWEALPDHADRYARATEHVAHARRLWDGWEDDALVADADRGVFVDPVRLHPTATRGDHVSGSGLLAIPRPPQGHPVVLQAGSSEDGRALAAAEADVVFTTQPDLASASAFTADLRARAAARGRDPDAIRVLAGVNLLVAATAGEAEDVRGRLTRYADVTAGLRQIHERFGVDLRDRDPEDPFPALDVGELGRSRADLILRTAADRRLSIREVAAMLTATRGHREVTGDAHGVADTLEEWWAAGAVDGYIITLPYMDAPLHALVDRLVPELQRRGIFRTRYEGTTLRDHLGIPRPPHGAHHPTTTLQETPS